MPGCAAIGCNNRSEKGYTMKCFPRDPALRTLWKKKVGRADWEPSNNSFLCHKHFDPSEWISTSTGKIKLKKGAVPTIFTVNSTRRSFKKKQDLNMDKFEIEYLDSPVILNLVNQKTNIISIQSQDSELTGQILQNISILSSDTLKSMQNKNIYVVSDENNREIGKLINDRECSLLENTRGKENVRSTHVKAEKSTSDSSGDTKIEIEVKEESQENGSSTPDYEALEKKLQAICHESDSSDSKEGSIERVKSQCTGTDSWMMEEAEESNAVGSDSLQDSSSQELDTDKQPEARKRRRTSSETKSVGETDAKKSAGDNSRPSNKTDDDEKVDESRRKIINDLESENSVECNLPQKKKKKKNDNKEATPIAAKSNGASKPIIKTDVLTKQSVKLLTVNNKVISNANVNAIKSVNSVQIPNENKLTAKLEVQAEVIQKLTSQLLMYKDMESQVKRLSQELSEKNKEIEELGSIVNKSAAGKLAEKKTKHDLEGKLKEASKVDLIDKVRDLDSQVKRLTKAMSEETKNRKQILCKLRSKESNIKDLNWKLDKASKFLERSEKNMNNYKKRMYSMRTLLKKQKLLSDRNTVFDKLFLCQVSGEFTNDALKQASDIKEALGVKGYQKLVDYNFPLPSLDDLNNKNATTEKKNVNDDEPAEGHTDTEAGANDSITEEDVKMEDVEYLDYEYLEKPSDTKVQTVQDIFDECSDGEDMNELEKHIMSEVDHDDVT